MSNPKTGNGLFRRYSAALAIIAATTGVAEILNRALQTTRLSMIFLAGVLIAAVYLGSGPGYFAAVAGFIIYNFYLVEPRFSLAFATPEDVFVLVAFMAVAMLTGRLAGRIRDDARRSEARRRTTEELLQASREFSSTADLAVLRESLVERLAGATGAQAIIVDAGRVVAAAGSPARDEGIAVGTVNESIEVATLERAGWRVRPLQQDGLIAFTRPARSEAASEQTHLIEVLVDLGEAALARARLAAAQAETEALARTEALRSSLLSSISHDLRTPLSAILASATSLRDFSPKFDEETRHDLALTIEEEARRLSRYVENLLSMTRLEGGALQVSCGRCDLREVAARSVDRCMPLAGARGILLNAGNQVCEGVMDPILAEQALYNVLENAVRFSPDGSTIKILLDTTDDHVLAIVADEGPGVPPGDLPRLFDKFFRGSGAVETLPGTGLGLSIAKGFLEAMGGTIDAQSSGHGLTVTLAFSRGSA